MNLRHVTLVTMLVVGLSGCASFGDRSFAHSSSSLVSFLYPKDHAPPPNDSLPELRVPLRVGLAFLPTQQAYGASGPSAAQREQLLAKVKSRFADRKFVSEIIIVPDYYLDSNRGIAGLEGLQRLYNVDVLALVSYDQVTHMDDNAWSLGYLTIVGQYIIKGNRHDVSTLIDLAVIDPTTRSVILRAGGTDTRHGNTTLVDRQRDARQSESLGFDAAMGQMIERFDAALIKFEADVREGKANVRVVNRNGTPRSGGGAFGMSAMAGLILLTLSVTWSRRRTNRQTA